MGQKPKSLDFNMSLQLPPLEILCLRTSLACDCSFFIASCSCFVNAMLSQISLQILITVLSPELFLLLQGQFFIDLDPCLLCC